MLSDRYNLVSLNVSSVSIFKTLEETVKDGLTKGTGEKELPCHLFYDEVGSILFEGITGTEAYYPTRCEADILSSRAEDIARLFNKDTMLVELGSGSSVKTRTVIEAFIKVHGSACYVPIDISREMLDVASQQLLKAYPELTVTALHCAYDAGVAYLAREYSNCSKLVMFLGSSIGNFTRPAAAQFLASIQAGMADSDRLLIGIDLVKSPAKLERAYNDPELVTAAFNLNVLHRINHELGGQFELPANFYTTLKTAEVPIANSADAAGHILGGGARGGFEHVAIWNEREERIEMHIRSLRRQTVNISALGMAIAFEEGETILTEHCHKYTFAAIDALAWSADLVVEHQWLNGARRAASAATPAAAPAPAPAIVTTAATATTGDLAAVHRATNAFPMQGGEFSLSILAPARAYPHLVPTQTQIAATLQSAWRFSDGVFALLTEGALLQRPITLRHPFVFYLGHLPSFASNQILRPFVPAFVSFNETFDDIFARGMDPDVEDPTKCHACSVPPGIWPQMADILSYREAVRARTLASATVDAVLSCRGVGDIVAHRGRVFDEVAEHDLMHAETLLYMYIGLGAEFKRRPASVDYKLRTAVHPATGERVRIPDGTAVLGAAFHDQRWGWDNEFPRATAAVPAFEIDTLPVTNEQFLAFVVSGAYEDAANWSPEAWAWKTSVGLDHPHVWTRVDGVPLTAGAAAFKYRTLFDELALSDVAQWPVYVSQAEASAYAKWRGGRLPTEGEFNRAAYGAHGSVVNKHPWGDAAPRGGHHGNFDLASYSPTPVGSHPAGRSHFGVEELVGNGWEWTGTVFAGLPGFSAYVKNYLGYSADFFDGKHYVLLGASYATATPLVRRSFRNWYQAHYQYVFAKFRCVYDSNRAV